MRWSGLGSKGLSIWNWNSIPYHVIRLFVSFAFITFFGAHFLYLRLTSQIGGTADVVELFLLHTSQTSEFLSVWVSLPLPL